MPTKSIDYNPDKERHVDHKFIVQNAMQRDVQSIETSKGELKLDKHGRCFVKDETLAREIQSEHPGDFAVSRVRYPHQADRGHRYHFGQLPEMPWKKKEREAKEQAEKEAEGQDNG